ncbi:hypothetical protein B484DRAFT_446313 [Ochromonadaceae sp. CCMP2298]|nr:hypothetical protein B484DRAFT_446313 [Ochromonadaceae sp. CCMP2298]
MRGDVCHGFGRASCDDDLEGRQSYDGHWREGKRQGRFFATNADGTRYDCIYTRTITC